MEKLTVLIGDNRETLRTLPDYSAQCVVTSPPYYGLRSYMPDAVKLKADTPEWVTEKLASLGIHPLAHTSD